VCEIGPVAADYPKVELHVHLDSTMRPELLLRLAERNDCPLPESTVAGLARYCLATSFGQLGRICFEMTKVLCREQDFRDVLLSYAQEATRQGAVYVEGIFNPIIHKRRGVDLDAVFSGYCDGAQEAREEHGLEVRLTPDADLAFSAAEAEELAHYAVAYRGRGVVGFGVSGADYRDSPAPFVRASQIARDGGLAFTPHAGEFGGAHLVRFAVEQLHASRIRHGLGAVEDPGLLKELAEAGIGLDICPISNVRLGASPALAEHPLPTFIQAGIRCSISSDDPPFLDADLTRNCDAASSLGVPPKTMFEAGIAGAFCDDALRARIAEIGAAFDWSRIEPSEST